MKKASKLIILTLCCSMLFGCSSTTSKTETEPKTSEAPKQKSTIEILTTAKTARAFTSESISEDHIKKIISAGLNAPSARNSQPWHFSVVTNKEILNQINEAMSAGMPKGGPGGKPKEEKSGNNQPANAGTPPKKLGLADATVAIFIYGTNNMATDSFDCGLATEAMSVAALSLGYGTKIVSSPSIALNGEKKAEFDKLLQIPEGYSNVAVLLIGHNDNSVDATSSASTRNTMDEKVKFIN